MADYEARFWSKVDRSGGPDACWLWTGSTSPSGYAQFRIGSRRPGAHRVAYELLVGPIPCGLVLDHVAERGCRHRHCVNPAHLEPPTQAENTRRAAVDTAQWQQAGVASAAELRRARTHCRRGHEFTPENTARASGGGRRCKACAALHQRDHRRRLGEAA